MNSFNKDLLRKIKGLIEYYDLGYVLNNLDSVITLPLPKEHIYISEEKHSMNKRLAKKSHRKAMIGYEGLSNEYDIRKSTFDAIRQVYPEFCKNMSKKLSKKDFKDYLSLLKKCSVDISTLIDSFETGEEKYNYLKLILSKKDNISKVIDNESNSRLTFYQDRFVLNELIGIDFSTMPLEIQHNIEIIKTELENRLEKYDKFQQLYSKNNEIKIKLKISNDTNKERE